MIVNAFCVMIMCIILCDWMRMASGLGVCNVYLSPITPCCRVEMCERDKSIDPHDLVEKSTSVIERLVFLAALGEDKMPQHIMSFKSELEDKTDWLPRRCW